MSSTQWSLSKKSVNPPSKGLLGSEDISLTLRIMLGVGGLICSLGVWELLIWPFFIAKLPKLGFLALPFVLMGLVCLAMMFVTWAYALLARRSVMCVDAENLRKELHLIGGHVLTKRIPLNHIKRLYVEESMDSETSHPWIMRVDMANSRHPIGLESFKTEATANAKLQTWRAVIAETSGINLPT
jgi:hypothetical protein